MGSLALAPVIPAAALRADPPAFDGSEMAASTRQLVAGDDEAWRDFHEKYAPRLRRYLLVICRGREDTAGELLQQTFLRAVKHIRVCETEGELWAWLALLARSAAADAGRRERRYLGFLDRWFRQQPPSVAEPPAVEARLEEVLATELAELPDQERELLERKYFGRLSVRKLAAESGISEKAVESRLTRTRQKLKSALLARLQHENHPRTP